MNAFVHLIFIPRINNTNLGRISSIYGRAPCYHRTPFSMEICPPSYPPPRPPSSTPPTIIIYYEDLQDTAFGIGGAVNSSGQIAVFAGHTTMDPRQANWVAHLYFKLLAIPVAPDFFPVIQPAYTATKLTPEKRSTCAAFVL